ncbi:UNVERIFIED_CONTAM: hypothetical protein Sradi_7156000 [Sesamum radiatum]|uniref:Uncharacterized protein n=1 Tax=Sesamum radiatum TaxID=300843 RepID=A0AAW2IXI2_SESRA
MRCDIVCFLPKHLRTQAIPCPTPRAPGAYHGFELGLGQLEAVPRVGPAPLSSTPTLPPSHGMRHCVFPPGALEDSSNIVPRNARIVDSSSAWANSRQCLGLDQHCSPAHQHRYHIQLEVHCLKLDLRMPPTSSSRHSNTATTSSLRLDQHRTPCATRVQLRAVLQASSSTSGSSSGPPLARSSPSHRTRV